MQFFKLVAFVSAIVMGGAATALSETGAMMKRSVSDIDCFTPLDSPLIFLTFWVVLVSNLESSVRLIVTISPWPIDRREWVTLLAALGLAQ
ncbi:hypothetical protein B0H16DRAFT_1733249 [Mycena metata]|uniref:Uncharacterized protein n=1 Tax=Mycena metata TaxID=1033252 RepID=A0AAD7I115_9AGAR|nr:hypothetical protein B0H16DRAFT_1733249 [Mycena metata]